MVIPFERLGRRRTTKNSILAASPKLEFARLAESQVRVELAFGEPLQRTGDKIEYLCFVENGFMSATTILSDGAALEIGQVSATPRVARFFPKQIVGTNG